jgi:hypothetical protein
MTYPKQQCCLCGADIHTILESHNPWPLSEKDKDRCCGECNTTKVIPARVARFYGLLQKEEQGEQT